MEAGPVFFGDLPCPVAASRVNDNDLSRKGGKGREALVKIALLIVGDQAKREEGRDGKIVGQDSVLLAKGECRNTEGLVAEGPMGPILALIIECSQFFLRTGVLVWAEGNEGRGYASLRHFSSVLSSELHLL